MEKYKDELKTLMNSNCRVIEIVSYEWERVHALLFETSMEFQKETNTIYTIWIWSQSTGLKEMKYENNNLAINSKERDIDFSKTIDKYFNEDSNVILLIEDFNTAIKDNPSYLNLVREAMRDYSYKHKHMKFLILQSPIKFSKEEFEKELQIIEMPLPKIDDLRMIAKEVLMRFKKPATIQDKVLQSALGLTITEAKYAFSKAILKSKNKILDEEAIPFIISEKEQIIRRNGILEYYHPKEDLNSIGGLAHLKDWIIKRGKAFDENAKSFGLATPKGILLLGVPGCGKSLTAKAVASEWKFPLLRFDLGKVFGGLVGESEKNIREALNVATAISPCILWIDEIEKGLSGTQSSGRSDGGTSARVFGTFLTWMQEKKEPVFVVATANDISQLPAELLRKGRFDEIFFVDLPSEKERETIFGIHLKNKRRNVQHLDIHVLLEKTKGFSGAEIEQIINEALFLAYDEQTELETEHILKCIKATVPLSLTMAEKINDLRVWANKRARLASIDEKEEIKGIKDIPLLSQEYSNPLINFNYEKNQGK